MIMSNRDSTEAKEKLIHNAFTAMHSDTNNVKFTLIQSLEIMNECLYLNDDYSSVSECNSKVVISPESWLIANVHELQAMESCT